MALTAKPANFIIQVDGYENSATVNPQTSDGVTNNNREALGLESWCCGV
jgi:hypothetical protein